MLVGFKTTQQVLNTKKNEIMQFNIYKHLATNTWTLTRGEEEFDYSLIHNFFIVSIGSCKAQVYFVLE
jgi:hypothetical protein